jgi:tetraacyldisaccharide 4'-kinase
VTERAVAAAGADGTPSGLDVLRRSLWPFSPLYGLVASLRNGMFDAGVLASHGVDVPVWSVGNLTVGGTGKTPLVVRLCEVALARGVRVGVLARGYGRADGEALNDEGKLLARRFGDRVLQVQDPDRVRGAAALVAAGAEWILLDDGFQHRRLRRDFDIVCLDAAQPFGRGGMLPSGDLREPARPGLRRAGAVVLTRADRLSASGRASCVDRLQRLVADGVSIALAAHRPRGIFRVAGDGERGEGTEAWRGRRVVAAAAIARPASFAHTLGELGCEVVATRWFVDHHRFTKDDVSALVELGARHDAEVVVTEKDAVKLVPFPAAGRFGVVEIDLEFLGDPPAWLGRLGGGTPSTGENAVVDEDEDE